MKKVLKRFFQGLLVIIILANAFIIFTGRSYIYKGLANTYLVGKSGPQIDEQDIFYNRKVAAPDPQPWPMHQKYNALVLSQEAKAAHEKYESAAFVVIKNGELIFEEYYNGFDENSITNSFSVAKSFVSLMIGKAIEEGHIASVQDPVSKYLPEFAEGDKAKITIEHVLTMSSGLSWSESGGNPLSDNARGYYGWDLREHIAGLEAIEEPGKEFKYLSGNTQVLGLILEKVTGKTLAEYASETLWKPLNAEHESLWNLDDEGGMEKAFCCYYATARDYARIGQLVLNGGKWNGQQVIDADYLAKAIAPTDLPHYESKQQNKNYGYQWWSGTHRGIDFTYARGIKGQYIIVVPERKAVIVRTGRTRGSKDSSDHPVDLYDWIDGGLDVAG